MSLDQYFERHTSVDKIEGCPVKNDGDAITYEELDKFFHLSAPYRMDSIIPTRMEFPEICRVKIADPEGYDGERLEGFVCRVDTVATARNNYYLSNYMAELYDCGTENCVPMAVDREDLEELLSKAERALKTGKPEEEGLYDYGLTDGDDAKKKAIADICDKVKFVLDNYDDTIFCYEEWY